MVNKIRIERECEHKIIMKKGLVLVITASEFIHKIEELDKAQKYATTNVSIVNDYYGAILSKISGNGFTFEEAYQNCISNFNNSLNSFKDENQILLCCKNPPSINAEDLQDFSLTRSIKFSWTNEEKVACLLTVYVRTVDNKLLFTYDGSNEVLHANSDKEIIEYILSNCEFRYQPVLAKIKSKGSLFYPTIKEFLR